MSLPLLLQGLGSVGVFASRAFLPAFVTALMLRIGPQSPWLARTGLLPHVRDLPTWFTSDAALVVLGILAALELVAERSTEARVFLGEVQGYLKAVMAAVTYLGVLNTTDRAAFGRVVNQAGLSDALPVMAVAAGTLLASRARSRIIGPLIDADEGDDLGLQRLLRWVGDLWGAMGPLLLILFPLLALAAFGLAALILVLIERRFEAMGDGIRVPCARCGSPVHPSAPSCPSCRAPIDAPKDIGLLGLPKKNAADVASLPYRLFAVKRCPACATQFKGRSVDPACDACGHRPMSDPGFVRGYIASIDRRVPLACVACFLLGLIPVLGIIPGVINYRLAIVAPFRRHIPPGRGFLLRWGVRLAILVLVALQWVPVAGGFALPAMALINYGAYRTAYRQLAMGI